MSPSLSFLRRPAVVHPSILACPFGEGKGREGEAVLLHPSLLPLLSIKGRRHLGGVPFSNLHVAFIFFKGRNERECPFSYLLLSFLSLFREGRREDGVDIPLTSLSPYFPLNDKEGRKGGWLPLKRNERFTKEKGEGLQRRC